MNPDNFQMCMIMLFWAVTSFIFALFFTQFLINLDKKESEEKKTKTFFADPGNLAGFFLFIWIFAYVIVIGFAFLFLIIGPGVSLFKAIFNPLDGFITKSMDWLMNKVGKVLIRIYQV